MSVYDRRGFITSLAAAAGLSCSAAQQPAEVHKDVPYVPTPDNVVQAMLDLAKVSSIDTVYDLGCGDGRIVVAAAKRGAAATGFDIDPVRIQEAEANARAAGVEGRAKFVRKNLFDVDMSPASVVTLYLLPSVNMKLRPRLREQLKPGSRVVSHGFDMEDWKPERKQDIDGTRVLLWVIPARA